MTAPSLQTCLWLDDQAQEAAEAYVALLPGSRILQSYPRRGGAGGVWVVQVELLGQRYTLLNGGPHFKLTPAASIEVHLDTQAEVDRLWEALLEGGAAQRCGWLTDRFGVSWQIIPRTLFRLVQTPDETVAQRVLQAMMGMVKLDAAALEAAAAGQ
jgi:predicted 3-demethylubiquinone-9 3-methyltransferase (glyoxalase superfamily)